jgi:large subunit ribosomal protein L28
MAINAKIDLKKPVLEEINAKCAICEKGAHFGNNVSHSHRRSNKMWKSNVKSVKVKVDGVPQKMYVCTSCLRSGKVERA